MGPDTNHAATTDNTLLRTVLSYALEHGASDVHLKSGRPPAMRVDGRLQFTKYDTLTRADMLQILETILGPEGRDRFLHTGDADHALAMPGVGRYRVNCFRQRGTVAVILRYVKSKIPTFSELNLPIKAMERIVSLPRGLVLITGTTSSGKSTTLAALLDRINEEREGHIVTLEDPIEYLHAAHDERDDDDRPHPRPVSREPAGPDSVAIGAAVAGRRVAAVVADGRRQGARARGRGNVQQSGHCVAHSRQ